ncbi:MAG TPA: L,D-transpeptidase family protein [Alphaproteobacteria bacterium]
MHVHLASRKHGKTAFGKSLFTLALLLTLTTPAMAAETKAYIGEARTIITKYEDTLPAIAEREQVGYAELLAANPTVDPLMPGAGTKVILPSQKLLPNTVHQGLVLNVGELRLYYFPPNGGEVKTFPIGIGREGLNTPMGNTTVTRKMANPPWRPTPRMLLENPELEQTMIGGDPENPLGKYALYMGWPSYLIHGTSKPKAVGRRASSGCIRMYAPHIEWLYKNVPVGTKITSVNQPVKIARIDGEVFIEATPSDIQIDELEYHSRQKTVSVDDGTVQKILAFAGDDSSRIDWHKTRQALIDRNGIPTQITSGKKVSLGKPVVIKNDDAEKELMAELDAEHKAKQGKEATTKKPVAEKTVTVKKTVTQTRTITKGAAPSAVKTPAAKGDLKARHEKAKNDFNNLN